jgi:hypothetical protein
MKDFSFTSFLTSNLNVEENDISALTEEKRGGQVA